MPEISRLRHSASRLLPAFGSCYVSAYRSDNFVIGLTDVSPAITPPTLWNYDVCGQYPGVVGSGATVNLTCTSCMPPRRYLVKQCCDLSVCLSACPSHARSSKTGPLGRRLPGTSDETVPSRPRSTPRPNSTDRTLETETETGSECRCQCQCQC